MLEFFYKILKFLPDIGCLTWQKVSWIKNFKHTLSGKSVVYTKYYLVFMSYSTKGQWNTIPRISQISKKGTALLTLFFSKWLRKEELLGLFHVHSRLGWREGHIHPAALQGLISHRQDSRLWHPWDLGTCMLLMCVSYST